MVADRIVHLEDLTGHGGVGSAYVDFHQTDDAEVLDLLARTSDTAVSASPRLGSRRGEELTSGSRESGSSPS